MSGRKPFRSLAEKVTSTPEGRARVEAYRRLMDAVVSLYRLREERGLTQVDVARALEVTQGNVSRVENASDLYISTLARYVEALGGHLELTAVFPDQVVSLDLREAAARRESSPGAAPRRAPERLESVAPAIGLPVDRARRGRPGARP